MSLEDFERLSPQEFDATYKAFRDYSTAQMRDKWERTRTLALFTVQPYCKKRIKAKELMHFEWDTETQPQNVVKSSRERMGNVLRKIQI